MVFEAGQWEDDISFEESNDSNRKSGSRMRSLLLIREIREVYEVVVIGLGSRLK